jgi:hypothetical protein
LLMCPAWSCRAPRADGVGRWRALRCEKLELDYHFLHTGAHRHIPLRRGGCWQGECAARFHRRVAARRVKVSGARSGSRGGARADGVRKPACASRWATNGGAKNTRWQKTGSLVLSDGSLRCVLPSFDGRLTGQVQASAVPCGKRIVPCGGWRTDPAVRYAARASGVVPRDRAPPR